MNKDFGDKLTKLKRRVARGGRTAHFIAYVRGSQLESGGHTGTSGAGAGLG